MRASAVRGIPPGELAARAGDVRRILVRAPSWLGDAVLALPVLDGLRRTFPGAELVVSAKPGVAGLFTLAPAVARVLPDGSSGRARGLLAAARRLRREACDVAVLLPNAFGAALLACLAGIPHRVGYARDGRGALLTAAVPVPGAVGRWHQADYYRALMTALGWDEGDRRPPLVVPRSAEDEAQALLAGTAAGDGRPLVAVAPGAAYGSAKRWPPERFAAAADRIAGELGGAIVLLGSPAEAAGAEALAASARAPTVNLCGRTGLPVLAALLRRCRLALTNDSGAMHLAAALGTPVVAVFGPTHPAATGPLGPAAVVRHPVPCSPCGYRACPIGHPCMAGVAPEAVVEAARSLLAGPGPPAEARWVGGARPAVFLDRDGTINEEAGYIRDPGALRLIPGALEALRLFRERGFALVVVTNQAGVARGLMTEGDVAAVNAELSRRLAQHGVAPDAFYVCPHHAEHGAPPYRRACTCRKPGAGLLLRAAREHDLDLGGAAIIGDHWTDVQAGRRLGLRAALVLTGHGGEEWARHRDDGEAVHVAPDLLAATRWCLGQAPSRDP